MDANLVVLHNVIGPACGKQGDCEGEDDEEAILVSGHHLNCLRVNTLCWVTFLLMKTDTVISYLVIAVVEIHDFVHNYGLRIVLCKYIVAQ